MTNRDKYNELQAFIAQQDKEWDIHRREIGFIGRILENLFGSAFAHKQFEEFKRYCFSNNINCTNNKDE